MSKLAHSNEETMLTIEIRAAYNDMDRNEFYEHVCINNIRPEDIEKALGEDVVKGYNEWTYFHIK